MFVDATTAFAELDLYRGVELAWDEQAGRVVVSLRLGRLLGPRQEIAEALSAANSELGVVGFRLDGEDVVYSQVAFLEPDGRVSLAVLRRLATAALEAARRFTTA